MKKEKVCKENYVCFKAILLLSLLIFSLNTCKWITYHNFTRFPITLWYRWNRVKFYKYQHLRLAWSFKISVFSNNSWIYCTLLLFWLKKNACINKDFIVMIFFIHIRIQQTFMVKCRKKEMQMRTMKERRQHLMLLFMLMLVFICFLWPYVCVFTRMFMWVVYKY